MLGKLRLLHLDSWRQGHAAGVTKGMETGSKDGYREGYGKGYTEGYEAGKVVLDIRDHRTIQNPKPEIDDNLFEDWLLQITPQLESILRTDVAQKLPAHKRPTPSQWRMILSKTPATVVVAGAGSGKSTTLILRILLLHHYLGFELDALTVVTFTNMSRRDFIKKLRNTFLLWEMDLDQAQAERLVRTFHSMILGFTKVIVKEQKLLAFEFLDGNKISDAPDDVDVNPLDFEVGNNQRDLLNQCYKDLCDRNSKFRELMSQIFLSTVMLKRLSPDDEKAKRRSGARKAISERDAECMDIVEKAWADAGVLPLKGLELRRESIDICGYPLQINGRIPALNAVLVLGAKKYPGSEFFRAGSKFELVRELKPKQTLLQTYCTERVVWIDDEKVLKAFVACLMPQPGYSPGFDYKIEGELSPEPVLDCFVGVANFIENLGLEVSTTVKAMKFIKDSTDALFFEALGLFWPSFMIHLEQQHPRVMTFNRMFSLFNEHNPGVFERLPAHVLRPMSHLMIDEFQDISPQIVSWVRGSQREIRRRGKDLHEGRTAQWSSLVCVGDDWQSIYGWRGSAPKYFLEFKSEFKSPSTEELMLRENYRSHQHIIDAAEHIVRDVQTIPGKSARAAGLSSQDPIPVSLSLRDEKRFVELVEFHYKSEETGTIMILYRKGDERKVVKQLLSAILKVDQKLPEDEQRILMMTFHKSKGLEAHTVFLIGDCQFLTSSPYKNQAYKIANLGQLGDPVPYDSAQQEEIRRLAYVGITRAARYCYWFIDPPSAWGAIKPKASNFVSSGAPFFYDTRALMGKPTCKTN